MSEPTDNTGWTDSSDYRDDPTGTAPLDRRSHTYDIGMDAFILSGQKDIMDDIVNNVTPVLPTTDQKAALDANATLSASNAVASQQDITSSLMAASTVYTFRTATDTPGTGEVKLNNATPASATIIRCSNLNWRGTNVSNVLLGLGENDAFMIQVIQNADEMYNFDITGTPTQVGGAGAGGYLEIPVTLFSQGSDLLDDEDDTTVTAKFDGNNTRFLQKSANLSDVQSAATSRTNLGLGTAAQATVGTSATNVPQWGSGVADSTKIVDVDTGGSLILTTAKNAHNQNFGVNSYDVPYIASTLGNSLTLETNGSGHLITAAKGTAYNKAYGTGSGTTCQGNDSRLSDSRTPTSHGSTHLSGGSDPISGLGTGTNLAAGTVTNTSAVTTMNIELTTTGIDTTTNPLTVDIWGFFALASGVLGDNQFKLRRDTSGNWTWIHHKTNDTAYGTSNSAHSATNEITGWGGAADSALSVAYDTGKIIITFSRTGAGDIANTRFSASAEVQVLTA